MGPHSYFLLLLVPFARFEAGCIGQQMRIELNALYHEPPRNTLESSPPAWLVICFLPRTLGFIALLDHIDVVLM